MNHTQGFSKQIRASLWSPSTHWSNRQSNAAIREELDWTFTPQTHSIPEIACIICLVIISRSSSDRRALLSSCAGGARGIGSGLPVSSLTFSLLARSCWIMLLSLSTAAASDKSRAATSANTAILLPDMTIQEKQDLLYAQNFPNPSIEGRWVQILYLLKTRGGMYAERSGAHRAESPLFILQVLCKQDGLKSKVDNGVHRRVSHWFGNTHREGCA